MDIITSFLVRIEGVFFNTNYVYKVVQTTVRLSVVEDGQ
jgi:hypothetical protein